MPRKPRPNESTGTQFLHFSQNNNTTLRYDPTSTGSHPGIMSSMTHKPTTICRRAAKEETCLLHLRPCVHHQRSLGTPLTSPHWGEKPHVPISWLRDTLLPSRQSPKTVSLVRASSLLRLRSELSVAFKIVHFVAWRVLSLSDLCHNAYSPSFPQLSNPPFSRLTQELNPLRRRSRNDQQPQIQQHHQQHLLQHPSTQHTFSSFRTACPGASTCIRPIQPTQLTTYARSGYTPRYRPSCPLSCTTRSSASPFQCYSPPSQQQQPPQLVSLSGQPISSNTHNNNNNTQPSYSYHGGTSTYQEQSHSAGFTYVHTTPMSRTVTCNSLSSHDGMQPNSYPTSFSNDLDTNNNHSRLHPPSPPTIEIPSRHSLSHICHPSTYQRHHHTPPSPESSGSASSQTPGPTTPHTPFTDDTHYGVVLDSSPDLSRMNGHPHHINALYASSGLHHATLPMRFDSPPPILAPIQGERIMRGDHRHGMQTFVHQPLPNEYSYGHSHLILGNMWKGESVMRGKALVQ